MPVSRFAPELEVEVRELVQRNGRPTVQDCLRAAQWMEATRQSEGLVAVIQEFIGPIPDRPAYALFLHQGIGFLVSDGVVFARKDGSFTDPVPLLSVFSTTEELQEYVARCRLALANTIESISSAIKSQFPKRPESALAQVVGREPAFALASENLKQFDQFLVRLA